MKMSDILVSNITNLYGEKGRIWLEQLPFFLEKCEKKLNIKIEKPFPNLSYNYVVSVILPNGEPAVFKCGIPNKELISEIAALNYFAGNGMARLIVANAEEGWLLLEKVVPGNSLSELNDEDEATIIFANLVQKLKMPIVDDKDFSTIDSWLSGLKRLKKQFPKGNELFSAKIINSSYEISQRLLQSIGEKTLLHGDLHHDNILSNGCDSWLAIDPKGIIGETEYEAGAFMKNPISKLITTSNLKKLFLRRTDIIAEITGFDRERILGWSFVVAVLSAWWNFEDKCGEIKPLIYCAENLMSILDKRH